MVLAVTAGCESTDGEVHKCFSGSPYVAVFETDDSGGVMLRGWKDMSGFTGGADFARALVEEGCEAVITGELGPSAFRALEQAGVAVYSGTGLSVKEAAESQARGELDRISTPRPGRLGS